MNYLDEFKRRCQQCHHRQELAGLCKFSGRTLADISFEVEEYFKLAFPEAVTIPCPIFIDLKKAYDTNIKQAPVIEVLGKYKTGTGPEFFE